MKSGKTVWAKRGWKVYDDTSCRLVWRVWWMYGRLGGSAVGNAMYGYLRVVVRGTWGGVLAPGTRGRCAPLFGTRGWPSLAVARGTRPGTVLAKGTGGTTGTLEWSC